MFGAPLAEFAEKRIGDLDRPRLPRLLVFRAIRPGRRELRHAEAAHVHQAGRIIDDERQGHAHPRVQNFNDLAKPPEQRACGKSLRGRPNQGKSAHCGGGPQEITSRAVPHGGILHASGIIRAQHRVPLIIPLSQGGVSSASRNRSGRETAPLAPRPGGRLRQAHCTITG